MTSEQTVHPAKDQLIAFGQGRLATEESSRVEQHLEVCRVCCETLLDLKDDTFVGLVKVAKLTDADHEPAPKPANSGELTAQDTALKSGLSNHRAGYENEQAATLLGPTTETEDSVLDELPPELADHPRYRIVGLLGRGGMGNVYRAEHRLMSRPVAIKLINSNLVRNRMAVERFRREVQAAAKLSHPNIVTAYDAEQAGDIHFLVMEFVEGTDLASVVKERGPMSVVEACECIQQAAAGLQHAHEKGMVHRDIKPHNLMMSRESRAESREGGKGSESSISRISTLDSRPLIRILDFGLAGFAGAVADAASVRADDATTDAGSVGHDHGHLTTMGSVMGTPDYMAPEQAVDAHAADIRADIYALGCTLYFLLTGRPPFERDGIAAKLKAHASVSPPSLTEKRSDVPLELSDIVARMMAKKPENRFQTPDEVVAVLEPFVSPAISVREKPSSWRRTAIAAALILPVLLLGVIITIATDKGHIEIDARAFDDPHAQIILKKDGRETARIKVKPGHDTQTIDTGEYRVELVSADKDTQLDVFTQHRRTEESVIGIPLKSYLHTMQSDPQSPVMIYRGSRLLVRVSKRAAAKDVASSPSTPRPPTAIAPFDATQAQQHQGAWAKHLGVPVEYTNSIGMKFRLIPPGEFVMGSTPAEVAEGIKVAGGEPSWDRYIRSEAPQHKVTLTQPFYLGIHEVTQEQYLQVTGRNPSEFAPTGLRGVEVAGHDTTQFPVEMIDWFDAMEFCLQLSQLEQLKPSYLRNGNAVSRLESNGYRLPTEAQWEFACRAGTTTRFWNGDSDADLAHVAWLANLNGYRNTAVGQLKANPFGLFDVHGNAWEWIQDEWSPDYYQQFQDKPAVDPQGPQTTDKHYGVRGGIWAQGAPSARSGYRFAYRPTHRWRAISTRLALPVEGVKKLLTTPVSDEQSLQGRWVAKSIKAGNGAMPAGAVPQWTMTFNGQTVQVTSPTGGNEGTFKLNVSKDPKEIDIEPTDGKGLVRGIYRFVGRELEVCIEDSDRKRPIQWDVDVGTRQMLIRFQRESTKPGSGRRPAAPNRFTRDQEAGEWITRVNASLRVNLGGVEKHVTKPSELPDGDWQVTEISLYPVQFDASVNLEKLSGLKSLRWLQLFSCNVSDANIQQLTELPSLKTLDLDHNGRIGDASLVHIAKHFPNLEELYLHGSHATDAGLEPLAALKKLKRLNLSRARLNGHGLTHLASLPGLNWIALSESSITVENFAQLEKFPVLTEVFLSKLPLTDEAVPQLQRLSKLKYLNLEGTKLSVSAIEQLRESMPRTSIQTVPTSRFPAELTRLTKNTSWNVLKEVSLNAKDGAQLRQRDDGAILAEGANPHRTTYKISGKISLKRATALRLEVLRDGALPNQGPGRANDGTFVLTGLEVRFKSSPDAEEKIIPIGLILADYTQSGNEIHRLPFGDGTWSIWRGGQPLQNQVLLMELGRPLELSDESVITITLKHESNWPGCNLGCFRLSVGESLRQAVATVNRNLLTDPSFENTAFTQLPEGWRGWLNDGQEFRCEVVAGGHTGQRCLKISGQGTRGVVFGNDLKADRTKRYALKGWAKFEGDKAARAIIKLNYFRGSEFLGVHDLVGATADQGWQHFEKTDALDAFPTADHFYAMCHVEGSGTGWFDDLELVAYDRDTLPKDFDARHGRHNRQHGPNSLHRWVGTWRTEYAFREFDNSPVETKLTMTTTSERTLGDYFLMSHAKAEPVAPQDRKPTPADPAPNAAALGGEERLMLLTFDQNLGAFRQWDFSSNGKAFEWRGPWDNDKQTLDLRMLPDASNLHSSEHFVDADHIEAKLRFQYVMGERDGGRWTATRKAFDGKVDVPVAKTHVAEPAELSQLNKFVGEWTIHAKYKPSVWNPQPREETITETSHWILGGRFLMTRAFNEQGQLTSIWIATYEPREKSNRFWFFNADGSSSEWRLTWDETASGFQFRAIDMFSGGTGTGFNHWIDADSFDNTALVKDGAGGVLLDSVQERRRKK